MPYLVIHKDGRIETTIDRPSTSLIKMADTVLSCVSNGDSLALYAIKGRKEHASGVLLVNLNTFSAEFKIG